MSAADREAIAGAATTVGGVTVTPYSRQVTKPGQGWVRLSRREADTSGLAFFNNVWQVFVVLPQDIAAAEKYLDQKLNGLIEAIGEQMVVTRATPVDLALDTGKVPVVVIEGTRESE